MRLTRMVEQARQLFPHHQAHAAAHKSEIHDSDRGAAALNLADAGDYRVVAPAFAAGLGEALRIGVGIDELERIAGRPLGKELAPRSAIDRNREPLLDRQRHMKGALRTYVEVALGLLAKGDLLARRTLGPDLVARRGGFTRGCGGRPIVFSWRHYQNNRASHRAAAIGDGPRADLIASFIAPTKLPAAAIRS